MGKFPWQNIIVKNKMLRDLHEKKNNVRACLFLLP